MGVTLCTVEDLTLKHYKGNGYRKGNFVTRRVPLWKGQWCDNVCCRRTGFVNFELKMSPFI